VLVILAACAPAATPLPDAFPGSRPVAISEIALSGLGSKPRQAEVSGLAWLGDRLILLPQYPRRFEAANANGSLFYLERSEIEAAIDNHSGTPLALQRLPFDDGGLADRFDKFEGFEAIAASADGRLYLTVETSRGVRMTGYLVSASLDADGIYRVDASNVIAIQPQTNIYNFTDEALLLWQDRVLTFYEGNGRRVNPQPVAHVYSRDLSELPPVPFPNLEYRVTDASAAGPDGSFWVINYQNRRDPGIDLWRDPLGSKYRAYPPGPDGAPLEQLVRLQITPDGVVLADAAPVRLVNEPDGKGRNWEGLAQLPGRGFLLVTDNLPRTIFAFVPYNPGESSTPPG
jgi:hypothetical protein